MVTTDINYGCKAQRRVGGVDQGEEGATGGSPVCFDGQLSKLDTEAAEGRVDGIDNGPGGDCRVFSVGSAENAAGTNRVAFVKAMIAGGAHGCSLDVMDPSIKRSNKSESAVIKSHPWLGLGVTDDKDTRNDVLPSLGHEGHEGTGSVRLLSLKTLMPLLGARKLALLKLDLDGGELATLESLLKAKGSPLHSIEQLVVEVHLWPDYGQGSANFEMDIFATAEQNTRDLAFASRWVKVLDSLRTEFGFMTFSLKTNPCCYGMRALKDHPCCHTISMFKPSSLSVQKVGLERKPSP
jgi:hypothetical protein